MLLKMWLTKFHSKCLASDLAHIVIRFVKDWCRFEQILPGYVSGILSAAELACSRCCISHDKNGIYGEMFVAAMIASAFVLKDAKDIILAGLDRYQTVPIGRSGT